MQQWIEDKYWAYLRDENVLKRAAHLVDKECRGDFEDAFLDRQMFSYSRDSIIREIIAALDADRYMPEACVPIAIPKSVYSQRPGAILPYRDGVLLQAIMLCIAPSLDQHLDKSVWSWRVRPDLRGKSPDEVGKRSIFRETELADFPFLKRGTVSRFIDQFEPWYALWPQFDRVTKIALNNKSLKFMVISDISGYFENIQLSLLHSLLSRYEPQAPNTINLLMRHLKAWCGTAQDGSQIERGIPQGNAISSFLGNFFLKPVDDHFRECFDASRVQYFRYVDDIRIVCAEKADATNAALALEAQIRKLKLNLQTAKTHVLSTKDALHRITDKRLDALEECRGLLRRGQPKDFILRVLDAVAEGEGDSKGAIKLKWSKPPLEGLNLRVLRVWANLHLNLQSRTALRRMSREALVNPNYQVTRYIQRAALTFPQSRAVPQAIWQAISDSGVQFPYQEAELIRGLKVYSHVPTFAYQRACETARNAEADPYLRLQSILLLCRAPKIWPAAQEIVNACIASPDSRVITGAIVAVSLNREEDIAKHIRSIQTHASPYANRLIRYVRAIRAEAVPRRKLLEFVFRPGRYMEHTIYEYAPFLRFIATGNVNASRRLRRVLNHALQSKDVSASGKDFMRFLDAISADNISKKR